MLAVKSADYSANDMLENLTDMVPKIVTSDENAIQIQLLSLIESETRMIFHSEYNAAIHFVGLLS